MRHRLYLLSLTIAALGIAVFGAANCGSDKAPTRPTSPNEPFLTTVEIVGPDTIPPGETARFGVRGRWSDGTEREISTGVTWQSTNTAVVSIDSSGTATGKERGTTTIRASITGSGGGAKVVHVLPDGTFRVAGRVSDTATTGFPIESALVEADSDTDRITVLTDARGDFLLYGVRRNAVLRVSKDGYTTHEQNLNLTTHTGVHVTLALAQQRPSIAGRYVLSIGSPQCEGASPLAPLAEELRQRTYTAVLTQDNARVTVVLSGRDFASDNGGLKHRFSGNVTATGATFELTEGDYYSLQDVIERLSNGTFLVITGRAVTTLTESGLAGTLNGSLVNVQNHPWGPVAGRCVSGRHAFSLTR